jgi:hypothetical protein
LGGLKYLGVCPFLQDFQICWKIGSQSSLMIPWISVLFVVISPFAFLILLIWVFSLILVRFARGLSILFIFSKTSLLFHWFFVFFFLFSYFSPYFYYFSPLACFGFACSFFLGVWDVALGHWFEIFLSFYICTHGYKLSS